MPGENPKLLLSMRVERDFEYRLPRKDQADHCTELCKATKALALRYIQCCPDSRELSLALTKLEEAVFWANASIAKSA